MIQLADGVEIHRDKVIEKLYEKGVGCSVHYIPLHLHPYWRDTYNLIHEMFPVSHDIYNRTISLPIYSKMTNKDVEHVIASLRSVLIR